MTDPELTGNLVKSFHLAVTYLKIYPPTSQMVTATLDTLAKALESILAGAQSVTLSELSGKLLIDGAEPENREARSIGANLLRFFAQKKVQSITFRAGVTRDELADFIPALLRGKREDLSAYPHIALDQTVYVAMLRGEEAVVKITEMVQGAQGDIAGLMTSLRGSYDLIDQLQDAPAKEQAQEHLAATLAKQDPAVLREIFDRELPPRIESSGLKAKLLSALSQDKIQEIFGQISVWYNQIREHEGSDFAAVERLEKLKHFITAVLSSPAAKQMPLQFFEDLLRKGLIEQLPAWFSTGPARVPSVFDVERLLGSPAVSLLEPETTSVLPEIMEKLCQMENNELLGRLAEKLLENLRNPAASVRLPAADLLRTAYDILAAHARESLIQYLESPLLEAARQETSADTHASLTDTLRRMAARSLLVRDYDLTVRTMELLTRQAHPAAGADEKLRVRAAAVKTALAGEIMDVLVADLKADSEKRRMGSLQVLVRIGDGAAAALVRVIKESDDQRARRIAAGALAALGTEAVRLFAAELTLGLASAEMRRVLDALPLLGSDEAVQRLSALARYPDPAIRRDIVRALAKLPSAAARTLIIEQLKDADGAVVDEAVRVLGELRCEDAVGPLIELLQARATPADLQGDICLALGAIGNHQAVPALAAKLLKRASLFTKDRAAWERVRVRAAWALGRFAGPAARAALETAARERNGPVAQTAKESLVQGAARGPQQSG